MRVSVGFSLAVALLAAWGFASAAPTGLQSDVVFTEASPLAGGPEIARRLLSPLAAAQIADALARSGRALSDQSINLADERFTIYVPAEKPPAGYGLLVFVPPWPEARLPDGWAPVLDRAGVIFVSAARSGNDANVVGRREPLALLALQNVLARYPVDRGRVWVGGFSGGSRIAQRLALAYPDVFKGALLNAGSDPLGEGAPPTPPKDLFAQFQAGSRLVLVTGREDAVALEKDAASLRSMRAWCVLGSVQQVSAFASHESADPTSLARGLAALDKPTPAEPSKLTACRAGIDRQVADALGQVETLRAAGKRDAAKARLLEIDKRFGGLAAPRSVELWRGD
jgi:predicted esterase